MDFQDDVEHTTGLQALKRVGPALAWAVEQLQDVADRPHLEAERLLAMVLAVERIALLAHPEWKLTQPQIQRFRRIVARRASGEPLPYILGYAEFFGLRFVVTPDVLIPRPETELLVERALEWLQHHPDATVVDVGTGSGCIAIALAVACPDLRIYATDLSAAALAIARTNARRHDVSARVTWLQSDLMVPLQGPLDLILSNPPYVTEREWHDLAVSVRHEPRLALVSGPQGLDAVGRLLDLARTRLASSGALLVEIGETQEEAVRALARTAFPNARLSVLPDLAGRPRLLEVQRVV